MQRRPKKQGEEGAPEWALTFGDIMSQLLTFFVLLISFSIFDEVKYNTVKGSLQYSFGVLEGWEQPMIWKSRILPERQSYTTEKQELVGVGMRIKEQVYKQELGDLVETAITEKGLVIRIKQGTPPAVFDSGSAGIKKEILPILDKIIETIKELDNEIYIEGHTDNRPINTPQFPSNWELSNARAGSVHKYLRGKGIPPERLGYGGWAEYHPISTNETEEGRARNRRVEIIVLSRRGDIIKGVQNAVEQIDSHNQG